MPVFSSKKFIPSTQGSTFAARYRAALAKHPFVLFGLPFLATMLLGSFFLTPATALRFERHDRKTRQMTREEEMGFQTKEKRKFDMREEYYRLAHKDLDNWEQKRVKRLPGEPDGVI